MSVLSIQLLKELSQPFHLTYSLFPFLLVNFSIPNSSCFPTISPPFKTLIAKVHGTVFLISLITKTTSDQLEAYPLAKMFLYFEILT